MTEETLCPPVKDEQWLGLARAIQLSFPTKDGKVLEDRWAPSMGTPAGFEDPKDLLLWGLVGLADEHLTRCDLWRTHPVLAQPEEE